MRFLRTWILLAIAQAVVVDDSSYAESLKCGIIGCDTSHAIAFTELINNPEATGSLAKIDICYAFPGGSDDIPSSKDRVPGFTARLRELGVEIVDSIEQLAAKSDAILLESVDGRKHLEQFRLAAVGKPIFIDKPIAASLVDTLAIFRIAEETNTPCFSASGLRYCQHVDELTHSKKLGKLMGASTASPCVLEPHHPDLFWYGIHGVESLYALLGPGCEEVFRVETDSTAVVVGKWKNGRIGTFRGIKDGRAEYTFAAFGSDDVLLRKGFSGYEPLVRTICDFMLSKTPPVSKTETLEIIAFMEAADASKNSGLPVKIESIMKRADEQLEHSR